jgi:hypothetical protein
MTSVPEPPATTQPPSRSDRAGPVEKTVGWILVGLAAVFAAVAAWGESVPGGYLLAALAALLGFAAVGIGWLVLGIVTLVTDRQQNRMRSRASGYWIFALVPAVAFGVVLILALGLPRQARFELDRSELEAYAAQVRSGAVRIDQDPRGGRIGTLPVSRIRTLNGCVLFTVPNTGFLGDYGYAHCLDDAPEDYNYNFDRITGSWYEWTWWSD